MRVFTVLHSHGNFGQLEILVSFDGAYESYLALALKMRNSYFIVKGLLIL